MVTRNLATNLLADLGGVFNPVILVYVDWPGAPVRVHNGVGNITFNSQTWVGLGKYGSISIPGEESSLVNSSATLTVSGTLATLLGELNTNPRNRDVDIYFGTVSEPSGNTIVGTPTLIFSGYVDSVDFDLNRSDTGLESAVSVGVSSGPSARSGATINHTAEDQAFKFPGDTAGRQVINAIKKAFNPDVWPKP
jgi:hypothetical protein